MQVDEYTRRTNVYAVTSTEMWALAWLGLLSWLAMGAAGALSVAIGRLGIENPARSDLNTACAFLAIFGLLLSLAPAVWYARVRAQSKHPALEDSTGESVT